MRYLAFACFVIAASPALAQQQMPRPTADQVNIQLLQNEANSYRSTIGQLVVKVSELTDQIAALKTKCGKPCEDAPPALKK
jgi:hypothetical protein